MLLTLKATITTAADDTFKYIFIIFPQKISLDVSCELPAKQMIHIKFQDLLSTKNIFLECRLLQILLGAL